MLNAFGAAWVQIDEPKFRFSIRQNYLPNVTSFYYMRLHGRNAAAWWHHEKSEDRYNYLYSAEELKEFSEIATAANELVKKSYLYTNNHFSSKSVVNAVMLKAQARPADRGRVPARAGRAISRNREPGGYFAPGPGAFTVARRMTSELSAVFCTTSIPEITCPITVYWPSIAALGGA